MTITKTEPLIEFLQKLAREEDRAAFAALRRGLGKPPGAVPATYKYVVPFLPDGGAERAWPYFVVASLFALHPCSRTGESLGRTYSRLKPSESRDRRFQALLNADLPELPGHLRQAMGLFAAEPAAAVDWHTLLRHLRHWTDTHRWVQQRWARDYWTPFDTTETNPTEA